MGHAWIRRLGVTAILVVLLTVLAAGVAYAQRVVLESYVGPRPAGAQRVMDALRRELPSRYKGQPALLAEFFSGHLPRPGVRDVRYVADVFVAEVREGVEAYANADFLKALRRLDVAIANARRNPAMVARDPAALAAMRRAMVYIALANKRMAEGAGNESLRRQFAAERDSWMAELLRSFGALPVRHDEFGSEAEALYLEARNSWGRTTRGALELLLPEPVELLTLTVNEMSVMPGVHKDLLPGVYRVLAQSPLGKREYTALVNSHEVTQVVIDWKLDALFVGGDWVGLHYDNDSQKLREGDWVARLLRGTAVREALVVNIRSVDRKLLVDAHLYSATGTRLRQVSTELDGPNSSQNRERLRQLVARIDSDAGPLVAREAKPSTGQLGRNKANADAPALPLVAGAGVPPPAQAAAHHETRAAVSLSGDETARVPSNIGPVVLLSVGSAAVIFGGVLYYYGSQPPPETPTNQATLFGSKPAGIATGLAGLAAIGAGWWLWKTPPRRAPMVSVSPGQWLTGVAFEW